jgi:DNA-binding transcriptional ArsR family regulator
VEAVFRALADPTRRALLDALHEQDGQTLVALTGRHDLTRVGIAKHLRLLEEAGLVVTKRRGREKLHYLKRWAPQRSEPDPAESEPILMTRPASEHHGACHQFPANESNGTKKVTTLRRLRFPSRLTTKQMT